MSCFSKISKFFLISFVFIFACQCTTQSLAPQKSIYIVGSFHDLKMVPGSYEVYNKLINRINPDLIFEELPVNWFDENGDVKKNYFVPSKKKKIISVEEIYSSLFENSVYRFYDMAVVNKFSREKRIRRIPFDIADRNKILHHQLNSMKDYTVFFDSLEKSTNSVVKKGLIQRKRLAKLVDECTYSGLQRINSIECDQAYKRKDKFETEFIHKLKHENINVEYVEKADNIWTKRRKFMGQVICNKAKNLSFKRALVPVGWAHRYHLINDLKNCGNFRIIHVWKDLAN